MIKWVNTNQGFVMDDVPAAIAENVPRFNTYEEGVAVQFASGMEG